MSNDIFSQINVDLSTKTRDDVVQYGTAGFRDKHEGLDFILYRMGLLSVLRSKNQLGKAIGLMITASHNPEEDNGVKLIDPYGEMLESSWEAIATKLANTNDVKETLQEVINSCNIDWNVEARVYLGRDTRESSLRLANLTRLGIEALKGVVVDYGVVTTPMLHYFVAEMNVNGVQPVPEDYFKKLGTAFSKLNSEPFESSNYKPILHFDGANGVGSICQKSLNPFIEDILTVNVYNCGEGPLNHQCGSDFVKVHQKFPQGLPLDKNGRYLSVDGDADRIIYFYLKSDSEINIMDGDKISTLLATYLIDLLRKSNLNLKLGLVHTAYSNSAATDYISKVLGVPLACAETGVKHLHHKALEFDIGIYFEANGHGTVLYSDKAVDQINKIADSNLAASRLKDFISLTNQRVGDAISDMLLVETVLRARKWDLSDWDKCYTNLPYRLSKVTIKDRNVVTVADATCKCLTPKGLQDEIDRLVKKYKNGRSFVRASGTEDVVRVYTEASTQDDANNLAKEVSLAVFNLAGGINKPPTL